MTFLRHNRESTFLKKLASSLADFFFFPSPPCVVFLCQKQLLMSARNLQRSPGCQASIILALSERGHWFEQL